MNSKLNILRAVNRVSAFVRITILLLCLGTVMLTCPGQDNSTPKPPDANQTPAPDETVLTLSASDKAKKQPSSPESEPKKDLTRSFGGGFVGVLHDTFLQIDEENGSSDGSSTNGEQATAELKVEVKGRLSRTGTGANTFLQAREISWTVSTNASEEFADVVGAERADVLRRLSSWRDILTREQLAQLDADGTITLPVTWPLNELHKLSGGPLSVVFNDPNRKFAATKPAGTNENNSKPRVVVRPPSWPRAQNSVDSLTSDSPFFIEVVLPSDLADRAGDTIQVSILATQSGKSTSLSLSKANSGTGEDKIYGIPNPITLAGGGDGASTFTCLGFEFKVPFSGASGIKTKNEDTVTVAYEDQASVSVKVYDTWVQQRIGQNIDQMKSLAQLYQQLMNKASKGDQEILHHKLTIIADCMRAIDHKPGETENFTDYTRRRLTDEFMSLLQQDPNEWQKIPNGISYDNLGILATSREEIEAVNRALTLGADDFKDGFIHLAKDATLGLYQTVATVSGAGQFVTAVCGIDEFGNRVDRTTQVLAGISVASQAILLGAGTASGLQAMSNPEVNAARAAELESTQANREATSAVKVATASATPDPAATPKVATTATPDPAAITSNPNQEHLDAAQRAIENRFPDRLDLKPGVNQIGGAANEGAAAVQVAQETGEHVLDFNQYKHNNANAPLLDGGSEKEWFSAKSYKFNPAAPSKDLAAYDFDFRCQVGTDDADFVRKQNLAADLLCKNFDDINAAERCWPPGLSNDKNAVLDYIRNDTTMRMPADRVDAFQDYLRTHITQSPTSYGLSSTPSSAQIDALVNRVKSSGITTDQIKALQLSNYRAPGR